MPHTPVLVSRDGDVHVVAAHDRALLGTTTVLDAAAAAALALVCQSRGRWTLRRFLLDASLQGGAQLVGGAR